MSALLAGLLWPVTLPFSFLMFGGDEDSGKGTLLYTALSIGGVVAGYFMGRGGSTLRTLLYVYGGGVVGSTAAGFLTNKA